jgi:hypothetical protein
VGRLWYDAPPKGGEQEVSLLNDCGRFFLIEICCATANAVAPADGRTELGTPSVLQGKNAVARLTAYFIPPYRKKCRSIDSRHSNLIPIRVGS